MSMNSWEHIHADDGMTHVHPVGEKCSAVEALGYMSINSDQAAAGFPDKPAFQYVPPKLPQWSVTISATLDNTHDADRLFWRFCDISKELRVHLLNSVNVSATRLDLLPDIEEPEDLRYDENTLQKVKDALFEGLGSKCQGYPRDALVFELITSMQNYGILFRERR